MSDTNGAVRTIQDFIDCRMNYGFWCRDCRNHLWEFSLLKIVDRVGADFDLYSGKRLPVKCARCGGKNLSVVVGGVGTLKPLPEPPAEEDHSSPNGQEGG